MELNAAAYKLEAALALEKELGRWPRRLLHVPSMTSYSWEPGNYYGSVSCPQFNALSYTWGRFRESNLLLPVRTIDIKGISWSVPKINPTHFSVERLEAAIRKSISMKVQYLWIDIACIDQGGNVNSDLEIGRQAEIFRNAHRVYIWLSQTSKQRLEEVETFSGFWNPFSQDYKLAKFDQRAVEEALELLDTLKEEPWFSSVWTIQEAFLRKDAILLSANAAAIPASNFGLAATESTANEGSEYFQLQHFLAACDGIYFLCWFKPSNTNLELVTVAIRLRELGIVGMNRNDPMRLYATAMTRNPSNELDCIYGIQQIFGLRLGKTNPTRRSDTFTLDQLEDELGDALMRQNPVLSQNFLHTDSTLQIGKRWRLSRAVENPLVPFEYDTPWSHSLYKPRCTLRTQSIGELLCGWFDGRLCDFSALQHAWKTKHLNTLARRHDQPLVVFQLDVGSELFMRIPFFRLENRGTGAAEDEVWFLGLAELLVECTNPDVNPDSGGSSCLRMLHLGEHEDDRTECHMGLILFKSIHNPSDVWRRIGVCTWLGPRSSSYGHVDSQIPFSRMFSQADIMEDTPLDVPLIEKGFAEPAIERLLDPLSANSNAWQVMSGYFG